MRVRHKEHLLFVYSVDNMYFSFFDSTNKLATNKKCSISKEGISPIGLTALVKKTTKIISVNLCCVKKKGQQKILLVIP